MLSYVKSATAGTEDQLNGLENGKTQLFNFLGSWKMRPIQKKIVECSFKSESTSARCFTASSVDFCWKLQ